MLEIMPRQHRRKSWEDAAEPSLCIVNLHAVIPESIFDDVPVEALPIARKIAANFSRPIKFPDGLSPESARAICRIVYHLRHTHQLPLRLAGDMESPIDYVGALTNIARFNRELALVDAGLRDAARCIHIVPAKDPTKPPRWRVQLWDYSKGRFIDPNKPQLGRKGGHTHVGYADTEAEAFDLLAEYWVKNRGRRLPMCLKPGTAMATLMDLMREAAAMQGARNDKVAEVSATFMYEDDEDEF